MRSVIRAGALVLAAALAGCAALRDATHPAFISGKNAQVWIDNDAAALIAARHPGLNVGASRCPYLLDVSGKRTARCTIPVGGTELRVDVAHDPDWRLRDVDALVVRSDAERQVAGALTMRYAIPFTVRCDGPEVQAVPVHGHFTCAVDAPIEIYVKRILVETTGLDDAFVAVPLRSAGSRVERMLGREAAERTTGGITLSGPLVERYARATAGGRRHAELVRRGLLGAAHCPRRIVLSGTNHVTCTVQAGGTALTYDLRFDEGRGLVIDDPEILVVPEMRELAQRYFAFRERAHGPRAISVDCGKQAVVVAEPGGWLPCTAVVNGTTFPFSVEVKDADGNVTFGPRSSE
jgi:hypothetical protein